MEKVELRQTVSPGLWLASARSFRHSRLAESAPFRSVSCGAAAASDRKAYPRGRFSDTTKPVQFVPPAVQISPCPLTSTWGAAYLGTADSVKNPHF